MTKLFSLAAAGLVATGLTVMTPQKSEAGHPFGIDVRFGSGGFSLYRGGYGPYNQFGYYPRPRGPRCGYRGFYQPRPRIEVNNFYNRGPRGPRGPFGPGFYSGRGGYGFYGR